MNEEKCAKCGNPALPDAKFCESCGAPLAPASKPVCARCGTAAPPDAQFCESCGAPLAAASQPVEFPAVAEPAPMYAAPSAKMPYQGVGIRFVALVLDSIIFLLIFFILLVLAIAVSTEGNMIFVSYALFFVFALLYFTFFLGRYGKSVGMMLTNIKVVKEADGSPITYGTAFIRTILLIIDAIPFIIPYLLGAILISTSEKKQRLGDRVAHTVVVKELFRYEYAI